MIELPKYTVNQSLANLDIEKWEQIVELLTEIFDVSCGVVIQHLDDELNVVASSSNSDDYLCVNSACSRNIKNVSQKVIEANNEVYVKNLQDDIQWNSVIENCKFSVGSYLGIPLYWPNGVLFGSLCAIHTKSTNFPESLNKVLKPLKLALECELKYVMKLDQVDQLLAQKAKNEKKLLANKKEILHSNKILQLKDSLNSATLSSITLAALRISHYGTILSANTATTLLFGYSTKELIGKNVSTLFDKDCAVNFSTCTSSNTSIIAERAHNVKAQKNDNSLFDAMVSISEISILSEKQFVASITDISERVQKEALLRELALYDHLTKCANRNLLNNRMNLQISHAIRSNSSFSVIYIDLNKFKLINDCFGHQCGDQVLISVGKKLHEIVRKTDTVARVGGDEFIILMSEKVNSVIFLKTLMSIFKAPIQTAKQEVSVSVSVGFADFSDDCQTADELINLADFRMYVDKNK
jgi:diguanylate cyclase (GGDEF)-like protein/PAS domain S-box-containing protein